MGCGRRIRMGGHGEFGPETVDVVLRVVYAREFHEVVADGGVSPIGADHEVESDFMLWGTTARILRIERGRFSGEVFEPRFLRVKVGACELLLEVKGNVW